MRKNCYHCNIKRTKNVSPRPPPQGYADETMTATTKTTKRTTRRAEEKTATEIMQAYERQARRAAKGTKGGKDLYELWNDETHTAMNITEQYTPDLAIQWAMRYLKTRKKEGTAPAHATLTLHTPKGASAIVQGFRRT